MHTRIAIVIGLILYVIVTTVVSFFMMARVRKPTDYLVAGRGLPFWVLAGTITGTCIGTGVIIGGSGLAYQHGWAGCAYPIGLGLGTLITGLCFAEMRRYKFMTLTEEVSCYYDGNRFVTEFSNISLFISQVCWLGVQVMGGAAVVGVVTGLPPKACIAVAGFAKALISIPGGLKAVVYTDVIQTVILFFGFGFLIHSALHESGGLQGLRAATPPDYFSFLGTASFGVWNVISLILVVMLNPIADPGRRLTMYSSGTERSAKLSMVISGIVVMIFSVAIGITGMFAFKLNPNLVTAASNHRDQALPWLITNVLPPWLAAFVSVAVVSGISSAANGTAVAAGTFLTRHIYPLVTGRFPKKPVAATRWGLVFSFFAGTLLALCTGNIVDFVKKFLPLTMSGLGVIILIGRFWKRANWQGAIAGLVATPLVSLAAMKFWKGIDPILPATAAGIVVQVVVTFLTPPRQFTFEQVAERMSQERKSIEENFPHEGSTVSANADVQSSPKI
jgi:SSS family solute:Na+ symporter